MTTIHVKKKKKRKVVKNYDNDINANNDIYNIHISFLLGNKTYSTSVHLGQNVKISVMS